MEISTRASANIYSAPCSWTLWDTLKHKVLRIRLCELKLAPGIKTDPASLKVLHKFKEAARAKASGSFSSFFPFLSKEDTCVSAGSVLHSPSVPAGRRWGMTSLPLILTVLPHRGVLGVRLNRFIVTTTTQRRCLLKMRYHVSATVCVFKGNTGEMRSTENNKRPR